MRLRPHLVHAYNMASKENTIKKFGELADKARQADLLKEDLSHIDFALRTLNKSLEDTDYIGNARQVGYLDLMIYNELNQLECLFTEPEMREMTRSSATTYRLENFGAVNNWYRRVQKNPQVS